MFSFRALPQFVFRNGKKKNRRKEHQLWHVTWVATSSKIPISSSWDPPATILNLVRKGFLCLLGGYDSAAHSQSFWSIRNFVSELTHRIVPITMIQGSEKTCFIWIRYATRYRTCLWTPGIFYYALSWIVKHLCQEAQSPLTTITSTTSISS